MPPSPAARARSRKPRRPKLPPPTAHNFLVGRRDEPSTRFIPILVADRTSGDTLRTHDDMLNHAARLAVECTPRLATAPQITVAAPDTGHPLATFRVHNGAVVFPGTPCPLPSTASVTPTGSPTITSSTHTAPSRKAAEQATAADLLTQIQQ